MKCIELIMACVVCKQLPEICALNPAVRRHPGDQIYQLRWTRFNGYQLTNSGKMMSWGKPTSARGRLKTPAGKKDDEPVPIPIFLKIIVVDVSCGSDHVLALEAQLFVWSWGYNSKGQLGIPNLAEESSITPEDAEKMMLRHPERLNKLNEIYRIYADKDMSFAITTKGRIYAWGDNAHHHFSMPDSIISQPTIIPDLPWYDSNKRPIMPSRVDDEKNDALELVMARLDISEMKLLKEDNRDLKRRLTNHVKRLNFKEIDVFIDDYRFDTQSPSDDEPEKQQPFETITEINENIGILIGSSSKLKTKMEDDIKKEEHMLEELERKIEGELEHVATVTARILEMEPDIDKFRNTVSLLQEKLSLQQAKDKVTPVEEDPEEERHETYISPVEETEEKLKNAKIQLNEYLLSYENEINVKAEEYKQLRDDQLKHAEQLKVIQITKNEKDRLEKLIEVYKTTNTLTVEKLSDDYFESHKKVITANLNFLGKTQAILNETLIMEICKVVPISSILELMNVSRTVLVSMNDEIRIGIKKFAQPALRKLNLLWRIMGMNYALMGFVQDAVEELVRSVHNDVISEEKYTSNPYWNRKFQAKTTQTQTVFATRTKEETTKPHRECCF